MLSFQRLAVVVLALPFSGCYSDYWAQPQATEDKYGVAKGDCIQRAYAEIPASLARWPNPAEVGDLNDEARSAAIIRCMRKRGWTLVQRHP